MIMQQALLDTDISDEPRCVFSQQFSGGPWKSCHLTIKRTGIDLIGCSSRIVIGKVVRTFGTWGAQCRQPSAAGRTRVSALAFTMDGAMLAPGGADKTIKLWKVADGTLLRTLTGHKGWGSSAAFSPDGTILGSGSQFVDGITMRDTLSGVKRKVLDGRGVQMAFSRNGKILAFTDGKKVTFWSVATWEKLQVLEDAGSRIRALAFSPDGRLLAAQYTQDGKAKGDKETTIKL